MRAISIWQPWASAMTLGLKRIETRSWSTNIRGLVAIHASKHFTRAEKTIAALAAEQWNEPGLLAPPLGAIIGFGELIDVHPTERLVNTITEPELSLGDYSPGRFGWEFGYVRALKMPIPFVGKQGFFEVPDIRREDCI